MFNLFPTRAGFHFTAFLLSSSQAGWDQQRFHTLTLVKRYRFVQELGFEGS